MLTKRIIPCLDVDRGRVVKGVHFQGLRDAGDPVEVARRYDAQGADELVFLDISATHEGRAIMREMVSRVAECIFMPFTVGGGIRTLEDATQLIQAGAEKVSLNSAAVNTPELIAQVSRKFGTCATVVNIDPRRVRKPRVASGQWPATSEDGVASGQWSVAREDGSKLFSSLATGHWSLATPSSPATADEWWEVHINGGRVPTGLEAVAWAKEVERLGAGEIVLTSMDADGTKNGYDLPMIEAIGRAVNVPVVASGGAGHPEHLRQAFAAGADAALAASIFHYDEYSIPATKAYLARHGVPVRLTA